MLQMKDAFLKMIWLISGILLIFAGIVTIVNPAGALGSIAFVLALVMLISGIFSLISFALSHDSIFGAGWVLTDGIFDILISIFLFSSQYLTASVLPYIFGMWIIFTGITRMVTSLDLKKLGIQGWYWLTLIGLIGVTFGMLSFFRPVVAAIAIGIFVGLFFIIQGVASVFLWIYIQKIDSHNHTDSSSS